MFLWYIFIDLIKAGEVFISFFASFVTFVLAAIVVFWVSEVKLLIISQLIDLLDQSILISRLLNVRIFISFLSFYNVDESQ